MAVLGGIGLIPNRADTKAAPLRYRNFSPLVAAMEHVSFDSQGMPQDIRLAYHIITRERPHPYPLPLRH